MYQRPKCPCYIFCKRWSFTPNSCTWEHDVQLDIAGYNNQSHRSLFLKPAGRTATRGVLEKKLLFIISQYSQENSCVGGFFLIKLQAFSFIKKRLQHSCFPVNIAKFLRTPILKKICKRLLLDAKHFKVTHFFQKIILSKNSCLFISWLWNSRFCNFFSFKNCISKFLLWYFSLL